MFDVIGYGTLRTRYELQDVLDEYLALNDKHTPLLIPFLAEEHQQNEFLKKKYEEAIEKEVEIQSLVKYEREYKWDDLDVEY